jgi:hypothetical protein
MLIFVTAAALIVLSELVDVLEPLLQSRTYADVVEEFAELLAISSGGFALYLMHRAEREEVASLRRSANLDVLMNLSS